MKNKKPVILILEDDACFREILGDICADQGDTVTAADPGEAMELFTENEFRLLLLDWHICQPNFISIRKGIENLQPNALWAALFTVPYLRQVVAAMKAGASDILCPAQDRTTIKGKVKDLIAHGKPSAIGYSYLSRLSDSMTEKAFVQKTSLFMASREFSRTFLEQILQQQNLPRKELARFNARQHENPQPPFIGLASGGVRGRLLNSTALTLLPLLVIEPVNA